MLHSCDEMSFFIIIFIFTLFNSILYTFGVNIWIVFAIDIFDSLHQAQFNKEKYLEMQKTSVLLFCIGAR